MTTAQHDHGQRTAADLFDAVLAVSVPLHETIAHFDEPMARYEVAGPPGVAYFQRDGGDTISHESGSPSPELLPALDELRERHLAAVRAPKGTDNSHLPSLLLLSLYIVEPGPAARLNLPQLARRPAHVVALDEEAAKHDPSLEPHDAALRAWVPLFGHHAEDSGVNPAILEFHFHMGRTQKYVPWEHNAPVS